MSQHPQRKKSFYRIKVVAQKFPFSLVSPPAAKTKKPGGGSRFSDLGMCMRKGAVVNLLSSSPPEQGRKK
jgi:hypothetical protein